MVTKFSWKYFWLLGSCNRLSNFSLIRFLAIWMAVRKPPNLVEALSLISPWSSIALVICFSSLVKIPKPLAYSLNTGAISASSCKKNFIWRMAATVVCTCKSSSGIRVLPNSARFTSETMLYAPPKGKRLPSSIIRKASAVSSCKRLTLANSLSIRMAPTA